MKHKVGILGGTFDPPHLAHLRMAEEAKKQLGLEKILFYLIKFRLINISVVWLQVMSV